MALDLFRLPLIELGEFRTRGVVDPQKFIQFGMQRQIVAAVGPLDEERHRKYRQRRDLIPLERGWAQYQPQHGIKKHDEKSGGMSRRLPDKRGPVSFGQLQDIFLAPSAGGFPVDAPAERLRDNNFQTAEFPRIAVPLG